MEWLKNMDLTRHEAEENMKHMQLLCKKKAMEKNTLNPLWPWNHQDPTKKNQKVWRSKK